LGILNRLKLDPSRLASACMQAPLKEKKVSDHGWALVAYLGHSERKVALGGVSQLLHTGPKCSN
jgi:hypothetical protein